MIFDFIISEFSFHFELKYKKRLLLRCIHNFKSDILTIFCENVELFCRVILMNQDLSVFLFQDPRKEYPYIKHKMNLRTGYYIWFEWLFHRTGNYTWFEWPFLRTGNYTWFEWLFPEWWFYRCGSQPVVVRAIFWCPQWGQGPCPQSWKHRWCCLF